MPRKYSPLSIVIHIVCALLFGIGVAYLTWGGVSLALIKGVNLANEAILNLANSWVVIYDRQKTPEPLPVTKSPVTPIVKKYIEADKIEIPSEGKFITANLSKMIVTLYQNGQIVETLPIGTIGRKGAAWETPRGLYKIETKERNHFSSIGDVYMPFSLQFNGNYFIHGWTYYPDGTPVSASFSGGCIKLKNGEAEKVYNFAQVGTPVYVFSENNNEMAEGGSFVLKPDAKIPTLSAKSFLVADIDSGEVLIDKNIEEILPAGQLSQLLSSLVILDAVNFFNETRVKAGQITEFGSATLLLPGEKIVIKDLLYPMLFGDNGVAATTLAEIMGQKVFVTKMNNRALSIGLNQSKFIDPVGLAEDNKTTATDVYKLARHLYVFKNYLWKITQEKEKIVGRHIWYNQNNLHKIDGFLGGVNSSNLNGKGNSVALFTIPVNSTSSRVVAVTVLGSDNPETDLISLIDYIRLSFVYEQNIILPVKEVVENKNFIEATSTLTTLAFVGDIMLDRGVKKSIQKAGGDFNFPFANLGKIAEADILFGNLEGPVSDKGRDLRNLYSFRMPPMTAQVLQKQGFSVLSIANNHIGDWSKDAFLDTFNHFKDKNILLVGGALSKSEASEPQIIEKNGIKFGYLAFTDVGPNWLQAGTTTAGILLANDPLLPEIIKQASFKCDVLIVSYHFGNEYAPKANLRQRELALMAIDNGARVVVGHHPHVPQEIEIYRGGAIMYSLGNFIFDQNFSTSTMSGAVVKISFEGENISKIEELKSNLDKNYRVSVE